MTGDEIRDVDLGILHQDPFVESINFQKRSDQKPLYKGEPFKTKSNPTSMRRRSSLLLDKVLRRGSYNFYQGEDNQGFAMKKGSSVSSSLYSSSSFSSDDQNLQKSTPEMNTPWFIGSHEIELSDLGRRTNSTELRLSTNIKSLSQTNVAQTESEIVDKIHLSQDDILNYFSFFNPNNDGFITKTQLKRSMDLLGFELNDDDLDIMIQAADVDSDGLISLEDFKSLPIIALS